MAVAAANFRLYHDEGGYDETSVFNDALTWHEGGGLVTDAEGIPWDKWPNEIHTEDTNRWPPMTTTGTRFGIVLGKQSVPSPSHGGQANVTMFHDTFTQPEGTLLDAYDPEQGNRWELLDAVNKAAVHNDRADADNEFLDGIAFNDTLSGNDHQKMTIDIVNLNPGSVMAGLPFGPGDSCDIHFNFDAGNKSIIATIGWGSQLTDDEDSTTTGLVVTQAFISFSGPDAPAAIEYLAEVVIGANFEGTYIFEVDIPTTTISLSGPSGGFGTVIDPWISENPGNISIVIHGAAGEGTLRTVIGEITGEV